MSFAIPALCNDVLARRFVWSHPYVTQETIEDADVEDRMIKDPSFILLPDLISTILF